MKKEERKITNKIYRYESQNKKFNRRVGYKVQGKGPESGSKRQEIEKRGDLRIVPGGPIAST